MALHTVQPSLNSGIRLTATLNSASDLTPHPTLWYDDGSVVLQVEMTMFHIHHSILSAHSEIFKDMFAIPQSPSMASDGRIDGCPIIKISGDTAQNWENTLLAIYDIW